MGPGVPAGPDDLGCGADGARRAASGECGNAGLGGGEKSAEAGIHSPISGDEGACDTCGSHDCGCGDVHEALDENEPDWPTDEVTSDDALQYAGGLNKPKTTVAGDGQTTIPVTAVQVKESQEVSKIENSLWNLFKAFKK